MRFKTHKGDIIKGDKLINAINTVIDGCIYNSKQIRICDRYASHISEKQKDGFLERDLKYYETQREEFLKGNWGYQLWFLQKLDYELTGESVAILP